MKQWRIVALLTLVMMTTGIARADYDEGIEYQRLPTPVPTVAPGKVEVRELFWYGCPHCYRLEPLLQKWLRRKPANVVFVRTPAIFNPRWAFHAKVYYTAEVLGVLDKVHQAIFDAIHKYKQKLDTPAAVKTLFARYGVSGKDFDNAFNSFAVDAKVRRAADLTRRYGISGVPTMVVNGKYVTDGTMGNGHAGMLKIVDYLIAKESGQGKK
jgi:thiol:disulfide interchange protein DsbA